MRLRTAQHDSLIATIVHIVSWVVISVTLIALVYNIQFAPPQADDYTFARLVRVVGADSFVAYRYETWNGRFASDIWYVAFYSIIDVITNPWASVLIVIVLFTAGAWYGYVRFLGTCTAVGNTRVVHRARDAIALAGVLLFFYLLLIHTSALYGVSTAVPYQISSAHLLGQMAGLCALMRSVRRTEGRGRGMTWRQWGAAAGLAVSALFISGYQESFVLLSLLFYGVGALWSALHCRRTLWVWGAVSVMAVIGGIIVFVAPGNAVRLARLEEFRSTSANQAVLSAPSALLASLRKYVWLSIYSVFRMLAAFFCCLFVLLHIPTTRTQLLRYMDICTQWVQSSARAFRVALMLFYPGIIVAVTLPAVYGLGALGPKRVRLIIYFFLIAALAPVGASFRCSALYGWCARQYAALCTRLGTGMRVLITAARYAAVVLLVFASVALQF